MRMLVSDMAGRASDRAEGPRARLRPRRTTATSLGRVVDRVKDAGGRAASRSRRPTRRSSCCCATRSTATPVRHFTARVVAGHRRAGPDGEVRSEATVKVHAGGERIVATGEGNGPVNALDQALRQALRAALSRSSPSSSWSTTRCASSRARTAPARSPGCSSRPPTAQTEWDTVGVARERHRGVLDGARGRGRLRAAAPPAELAPPGPALSSRPGSLGARAHRQILRRRPDRLRLCVGAIGVRPAPSARDGDRRAPVRRRSTFTGARFPLAERPAARRRSSRARSSAIGKNYADHAAEMGGEAPADPVLFLKPSTVGDRPGRQRSAARH